MASGRWEQVTGPPTSLGTGRNLNKREACGLEGGTSRRAWQQAGGCFLQEPQKALEMIWAAWGNGPAPQGDSACARSWFPKTPGFLRTLCQASVSQPGTAWPHCRLPPPPPPTQGGWSRAGWSRAHSGEGWLSKVPVPFLPSANQQAKLMFAGPSRWPY